MLEMLRRVQWNFCKYPYLPASPVREPLKDRLENEHIGNMDQYRVTREVPLPYSFEDGHDDDADEEDDHKSISSWRKRKLKSDSPQTNDTIGDRSIDGLALRRSRE